jgi:sulfur-carrier protein adenylyltransferase/sulfurtransferase
MWWIKDPDRLKGEVSAVDALRENEPRLSAATPRLTEKLELAFDFDLLVNGETLPFTLRYPAFFPETPPLVIPRDGRQLSNHQYGNGGELCLEYRPDNWEPHITGARLIESAYRLLSTEMSPGEERAIVASEHSVSLGQQLRGWVFRFLLTR